MPSKKKDTTVMVKFLKNLKMPGKEASKPSYPPCNRAFTLRMMNPMSYQEGHVSPLDQKIQPLLKRSIAKSFEHQRRNSNSTIDDSSICSDLSYQDGGLYDIDENDHGLSNGKNGKSTKNGRSKSSSNGFGMVRSRSSADGFEDAKSSSFNRNSTSRSTLPVRLRSKSAPKGAPKTNGVVRSETPTKERTDNTLKRSKSLKERPKSCNGFIRSTRTIENRTPNKGNTVVRSPRNDTTSKQKDTRSKLLNNGSYKAPIRAENRHTRSMSSREDALDSDSTFSEIDGYNLKSLRHKSSSSSTISAASTGLGSAEESSLESSFDSALQLSTSSLPSTKPEISSLINKTRNDKFHQKVTDICNLISDKHPGDFQILEGLVEMQHAYEERNLLVNETIKSLQRNVMDLEYRLNNTPNIPSLIMPLMNATKLFERQMQNIIDSKQKQQQTFERSSQIPDIDSNKTSPLEEISNEANAVANQIEQFMINSPEKNKENFNFPSTMTLPSDQHLTNGVDVLVKPNLEFH